MPGLDRWFSRTANRTVNFGGNVRFVPGMVCRPGSEDDVLQILRDCAGERMRCVGSGHSWSDLLVTDGVLIDLRHLKDVEVGEGWVRVGGGCTLKRLLERLRADRLTLPTLGATTRQTIAGAISTGTHGSGMESLSNYVKAVKVAVPDAGKGEPGFVVLDSGADLLAARCALGCLGVIVEVTMTVVPQYRIEERVEKTDSLDVALSEQENWELRQFALLPWNWTYVVYHRGRSEKRGGRLRAFVCRLWRLLVDDIALHAFLILVLLAARLFGDRVIRSFQGGRPRYVVAGPSRVDASQNILTMHHCFRYVEMELFVPEAKLREAIAGLRELAEIAGTGADIKALAPLSPSLKDEVWKLRDAYTLHYPLFVRRVLSDETLISMASPAGQTKDAWYSISLISYRGLHDEFVRFATTAARCMIELVGARLHWGKYFPVPLETAAGWYPRFREFEQICRKYDPKRQLWV